MARIRTFRAVRPAEAFVSEIAALPYDVYSRKEAKREVEKHPLSFLRIDRPETQFPEHTEMYAEAVYEKARETLKEMERKGRFLEDSEDCYYVYRLTMGGRTQTGLVCCVSIDDYLQGIVKKHENTRADKEEDRIRHVEACSAHTGPIFLAYRENKEIEERLEEIGKGTPLYDFTAEDGVRHQVWKAEKAHNDRLTDLFEKVAQLYIADGHHRAASAVKAGIRCREAHPDFTGDEEFNYFLSVLFSEEQLEIYDYNRIVYGFGNHTKESLLALLSGKGVFEIATGGKEPFRPTKKGEIGMYLDRTWYKLTLPEEHRPSDPVEGLDVSVLQEEILRQIFGIEDPKTDPNLRFVGGIRGLKELEKLVEEADEEAVAFSMYPTSMEELFRVADEGRLMPPKSTWFEPKLRSGLLIHKF